MLLQFGVLGLQLAGLGLQVELLLAELGDHFLLGFPAREATGLVEAAALRACRTRVEAYMFFWV